MEGYFHLEKKIGLWRIAVMEKEIKFLGMETQATR